MSCEPCVCLMLHVGYSAHVSVVQRAILRLVTDWPADLLQFCNCTLTMLDMMWFRCIRTLHLSCTVRQQLGTCRSGTLPEEVEQRRQLAFDAVPLDPQLSTSAGVKLCTYQHWFAQPAGSHCLNYWGVLMDTIKLQRSFRFRIGSHMLPIEQGWHL